MLSNVNRLLLQVLGLIAISVIYKENYELVEIMFGVLIYDKI